MPAKRFTGYHDSASLPFKPGQQVVIPKGVTVRTMHPSRNQFVTTRQMKITIHHLMSGQSWYLHLMDEHERRSRSADPVVADMIRRLQAEYEFLQTYEGEDSHERHRSLRETKIPTMNPAVCWPGSGGYWSEVDINDILDANGIKVDEEPASEPDRDAEAPTAFAL